LPHSLPREVQNPTRVARPKRAMNTKKRIATIGLAAALLGSPALAQTVAGIQWTANQKRVIVRATLCDYTAETLRLGKTTAEANEGVLRTIEVMANAYALDPVEAAKLWEHERLGAIAGVWSVDSCPAYVERASAMSKRVAKQKYQQDNQSGVAPARQDSE
jgi:hypothetical protein